MSLKNSLRLLVIVILLFAGIVFYSPLCDNKTQQDALLWTKDWESLQYLPHNSEKSDFQVRFLQRQKIFQKNLFFVEIIRSNISSNANDTQEKEHKKTSKYRYPGKQTLVALFSNFASPKIEALYAKTPELLQKTGLDKPSGTIVLEKGNDRRMLTIGSQSAPNNRVYVTIDDGEDLVLLQKNIIDSIVNATATSYISQSLLDDDFASQELWIREQQDDRDISVKFKKVKQESGIEQWQKLDVANDQQLKVDPSQTTSNATDPGKDQLQVVTPDYSNQVNQLLQKLRIEFLQHEMFLVKNLTLNHKNLQEQQPSPLLLIKMTDDDQKFYEIKIYDQQTSTTDIKVHPVISNYRDTVDFISHAKYLDISNWIKNNKNTDS